jgi:PKD repeat protein
LQIFSHLFIAVADAKVSATSGMTPLTIQVTSTGRVAQIKPSDVEFFLKGSKDADEDWLNFVWDFGDGLTSTEKNTYHTYDKPG